MASNWTVMWIIHQIWIVSKNKHNQFDGKHQALYPEWQCLECLVHDTALVKTFYMPTD